MRFLRTLIVSFVSSTLTCGAASACILSANQDLNDISSADMVVVGKIQNYQIVEDTIATEAVRNGRTEFLENVPVNLKDTHNNEAEISVEYARFEIEVDEVLLGTVSGTISAVWPSYEFVESGKTPNVPFLIALRRSTSSMPALRGQVVWMVLGDHCTGSFLFANASANATTVRQLLSSMPE